MLNMRFFLLSFRDTILLLTERERFFFVVIFRE